MSHSVLINLTAGNDMTFQIVRYWKHACYFESKGNGVIADVGGRYEPLGPKPDPAGQKDY